MKENEKVAYEEIDGILRPIGIIKDVSKVKFWEDKTISTKSNVLAPMTKNNTKVKTSSKTLAASYPTSYTIASLDVLVAKDQGSHGSCVAHALSTTMEHSFYRDKGTYVQLSTDFIYGNRSVYDDYLDPRTEVDLNEGLNIGAEAFQIVMRYGTLPNSVMSGSSDGITARNRILANAESYKTQAAKYRPYGAYELKNEDEVKQLLYSNIALIIAIAYTRQNSTTRTFSYVQGEEIKHHAVCLVGWDTTGWIVQNSWSTTKSKSLWTVPYSVGYTEVYAIVTSLTPPKPDYTDLTADVFNAGFYKSSYSRQCYGSTKDCAEYLMYLIESDNLSGSSYALKGLTFDQRIYSSNGIRGAGTFPIKNYVNFGGNTDIQTSLSVADLMGESIDGFMLARNDDYVAVAPGTVLSGYPGNYTPKRYPILLTNGSTLDTGIQYFHTTSERGKKKTIVLAGPAIISDSLVSQISIPSGFSSPQRIYGANRYSTAVAISNSGTGKNSTLKYVIIVNSEDYPDSICAAALAARVNIPILYTDSSSTLNADTRSAIESWGTVGAIILGGTSLVSTAVENQLKNIVSGGSSAVQRIYGSDRYESSIQIINQLWNVLVLGGYRNIVLANGTNFSNMSSAALLAASINAPVILTDGSTLSSSAKSIITTVKNKGINYPIFLGSPRGSFSSSLLDQL